MQQTRLLLANDHPIIRSSLRSLLEREPAFRIVGEAADADEAMLLAEYLHPEIVLLDLNLKPAGGIAVARGIGRRATAVKVILLADQNDEEYVIEAFKAGAQGYVAEEEAPADLVRAVQAVRAGRDFVSPSVSAWLLERHARTSLTSEQKELYCALAAGHSEDELTAIWHKPPDQMRQSCHVLSDALRQAGIPETIARCVTQPFASK